MLGRHHVAQCLSRDGARGWIGLIANRESLSDDSAVPEVLLSAAMIVRDEAEHLEACLRSIRDVVDEIVIVDTGSTDRTVEIAQSFDAQVHVHPWQGSFAEPRNAGLELARGKWILYIDADERLLPISRADVRSRLQHATEVALRVRLRPFKGATPYWEYRLWRSDPRIRFDGVIHEKVTPSIGAVATADRVMVGESELFLDHVGYEGDQTHKHRRNLPLLKAQLSADPASPYNWAHLASALGGLGESGDSDAALERAVELAREQDFSAGGLAFAALVHRRREQGEDFAALLEEALSRYPDTVALAWLKICAEIEAGRYEDALRRLERFDVDTTMPIEDLIAYPVDLFGARAPEARGLCLFRLERYAEAAAAYRQAEEFDPSEDAHRIRRLLSEHRARDAGLTAAPAEGGSARWAARELLNGFAVDLGGVSLELRTTDATRADAVRVAFGRLEPSLDDPLVSLTFGNHRVPLPERDADESQGDLELWYDDESLSLAYGTSVSARVESAAGTVGGYASDVGRVFWRVAPFMLASLLAPHERFVVHGGAIERDGHAVLVLGGSGWGKSTLILGALRDGWNVLSDDLVLVRPDQAGAAVSGIPKTLAVPRDVVGTEAAGTAIDKDPRARVKLPFEAWDRRWHPITSVVVVGHGDAEQTGVESIEPVELLALLLRSMLSRQPPNVRRYTRLAITLCGLPARRLLHSQAAETRAQSAAEALAAGWTRGLPASGARP
jgi:tetratricopeptide (TPR) repeat protein